MGKTKTKKYPGIDIICEPSPGFLIGLAGTHETPGHDDCLPFRADIMVLDGPAGKTEFKKIGTVSNDGWGGPPEVHTWLDPALGDKAEALCLGHEMLVRGTSLGPFHLGDACEFMAALYIDAERNHPSKVKTHDLRYLLDDSPEMTSGKKRIPLAWE